MISAGSCQHLDNSRSVVLTCGHQAFRWRPRFSPAFERPSTDTVLGVTERNYGFKPGKSGNPGGRTKEQRDRERALSDAIRGLAGPNCDAYVDRLHAIALKGEDKESIAAIKVLFDRAVGKLRESIDLTTQPEMTEEEYNAEIAVIVREALGSMTPEERAKLLADPAPTATIQ